MLGLPSLDPGRVLMAIDRVDRPRWWRAGLGSMGQLTKVPGIGEHLDAHDDNRRASVGRMPSSLGSLSGRNTVLLGCWVSPDRRRREAGRAAREPCRIMALLVADWRQSGRTLVPPAGKIKVMKRYLTITFGAASYLVFLVCLRVMRSVSSAT